MKPISGWVYGLIHPQYPECLKVGKAVCPKDRLRKFQQGDPERQYEIAWAIRVPDMHWYEQEAHDILKSYNISHEWFRIDYTTAYGLVATNWIRKGVIASANSFGPPPPKTPPPDEVRVAGSDGG